MKCEIFVRENLPAVRALLAKELMQKGLTQQEVAGKLYLTQPAIAFYKKQSRGKKASELININGMKMKVEELCQKILTKSVSKDDLEKEYCSFCKMIFGK